MLHERIWRICLFHLVMLAATIRDSVDCRKHSDYVHIQRGTEQQTAESQHQHLQTTISHSHKSAVKNGTSKVLVCYFTNWAQYRPPGGKFLPEDVDPHLCTHIVYAFASMRGHRLSPFEHNDDNTTWGTVGLYHRTVALKRRNPKLKVLLAVGGWTFGTGRFREMSHSGSARNQFVGSVPEYLRHRSFDGLDLDWEYPRADDREYFTLLCKELREEFEREYRTAAGGERLLLTAAVPVGSDKVRAGYDVPRISRYLDYINVMAYDMHGQWEPKTGHHAPLDSPQLSVAAALNLWMELGAPPHKLVLGMPTYGRSFSLSHRDKYTVNSPAHGGGRPGKFTKEAGFLSYYEICELLHTGATYFWSDALSSPYLVSGDLWVGFDDERSIRLKSALVSRLGLAGAMVWTLDMDDFASSACKAAKFPLITAIREELGGAARADNQKDVDWTQYSVPIEMSPGFHKQLRSESPSRGHFFSFSSLKQRRRPKPTESTARVVCYWNSQSSSRPNSAQFQHLHQLKAATMCTHVIWCFGKLNRGSINLSQEETRQIEQLAQLKAVHPQIRLLLAVGGWMSEVGEFRRVASSKLSLMTFSEHVVELLHQLGMDGLDIHWLHPRGEDKSVFTDLIQQIHEAFDRDSKTGNHTRGNTKRLILSSVLSARFSPIQHSYDVPDIGTYMDMVQILGYDFHGPWDTVVGHPSPLYPLSTESQKADTLTLEYVVSEWLRLGVPADKLNVGLTFYARTFTLWDPQRYDVGSPVVGAGDAGNMTQEPGVLSYYEVCKMEQNPGVQMFWDSEQRVPFAVHGDQWIGFDDQKSLEEKVGFARGKNAGGVSVWSIDLDDFQGSCGRGKFPLLNAVRHALDGYQTESYGGIRPEISANDLDIADWEDSGVANFACDGALLRGSAGDSAGGSAGGSAGVSGGVSLHRDPSDCGHYFMCRADGGNAVRMPCPPLLAFNEQLSICDWPRNVPQCTV